MNKSYFDMGERLHRVSSAIEPLRESWGNLGAAIRNIGISMEELQQTLYVACAIPQEHFEPEEDNPLISPFD